MISTENATPDGWHAGLAQVAQEMLDFLASAAKRNVVKQISDEEAEAFYIYGYDLWLHQQFDQARAVFSYLVMFRPAVPRYWEAMARCCYDMEDYAEAICLYNFSTLSGGDPVRNLLQIAYCQFHLGELYVTKSCLRVLLEMSEKHPGTTDADVFKRSVALLGLVDTAIAVLERHLGTTERVTKPAVAPKNNAKTFLKKSDLPARGKRPV